MKITAKGENMKNSAKIVIGLCQKPLGMVLDFVTVARRRCARFYNLANCSLE